MVSILDIVSILFIVLTPLSYSPQYKKLRSVKNANGISVTATLILALCAQSQLPTMYYLFACPIYKRPGDVIPTPPRLMDWLNVVQLLMQWLCSLIMLGHVLAGRGRPQENVETDPATGTTTEPTTGQTADPENGPETAGTASPSARTAVILLSIHALLSVGWAVFAGTPTRDWLDLPFVVVMSVNYAFINPLITIATGASYVLQAYTASGLSPGGSALSRTAIKRQIVLFLALAVLWPIRFPAPLRIRDEELWLLTEWYPLVGWACVNNALVALGQGIVLYNFGVTSGSETESTTQETQPLLAA